MKKSISLLAVLLALLLVFASCSGDTPSPDTPLPDSGTGENEQVETQTTTEEEDALIAGAIQFSSNMSLVGIQIGSDSEPPSDSVPESVDARSTETDPVPEPMPDPDTDPESQLAPPPIDISKHTAIEIFRYLMEDSGFQEELRTAQPETVGDINTVTVIYYDERYSNIVYKAKMDASSTENNPDSISVSVKNDDFTIETGLTNLSVTTDYEKRTAFTSADFSYTDSRLKKTLTFHIEQDFKISNTGFESGTLTITDCKLDGKVLVISENLRKLLQIRGADITINGVKI